MARVTARSAARHRCAKLGAVRPANLADVLTRAAHYSADRVALVEATGRRTTWAALDAEADHVARGLAALGLVAGHRVMVALGNRVEFVATYLGALRAGLVVVPVNPRAATGELVRMMADCGARVAFADPVTLTTVRSAVAGLEDALTGADEELVARTTVPKVVVVGGLPALAGEIGYEALTASDGPIACPPEDPETLAVLLYTSGTSARPRAAMLTHRALLANIEQAAAVEPPPVRPDDVVLGVLPLFHVYGLNAVLGGVLWQHARLVLADSFDREETLNLIEDEAVSVVPVAPPAFAHWRDVPDLAERLSSVRLALSGSAPISPELVAEFEKKSGVVVHQGYGLTEAAPVVTSTLGSETPKPGSVGTALPGIEIRLVEQSGEPPAPGDPGEIEIRGENLFSGYWPDGVDGPRPDGWWATGDIGFLDADGDLFLVDRLKELVIVSGFNVYPSEVEEVIAEIDAVEEVAVIGEPDEHTGERVVAYVQQRPGASYSDEELVEQVRHHCAQRLARFKEPAEVRVVEQLPHTVTGKVAKGYLRETARRRHLGLLE